MKSSKSRACPRCAGRSIKKGWFQTKARNHYRRYQCVECKATFSNRTTSETYRQKKPEINQMTFDLLCSGVSFRRAAKILKVNRGTIQKRFHWISDLSYDKHLKEMSSQKFDHIQFDEIYTYEHSRVRPVSILVAVNPTTNKIVTANCAKMPSYKATKTQSIAEHGWFVDERPTIREHTIMQLSEICQRNVRIETDRAVSYQYYVRGYLPHAEYMGFKSGDSSRGEYDPLFWVNHTAAKLRADLARMRRKTWCCTKKLANLQKHLYMYLAYHNGYFRSLQRI